MKPVVLNSNPCTDNTSGRPAGELSSPLAQATANHRTDPDLARLLDAWPRLPAHLRQTILDMMRLHEPDRR